MIFRAITILFPLYTAIRQFPLQPDEKYLITACSTYLLLFLFLCASFIPAMARFIKGKKISTDEAIRNGQERQIIQLNQEIASRTHELNTLRQALAADFHDETGNLLSVIIHQATLLRLKADKDLQPIVENIFDSSQQLYAASKHLLWNLHHDSNDPCTLFEYIVNFGQTFCNKVDICFSAEKEPACSEPADRLEPAAALNLVFIFKEAMNNVAKHAGAKEMVLKMAYRSAHLVFELWDDGRWKEPDPALPHYGISGIERRCLRNGFTYRLFHDDQGTRLEIAVPVTQVQPAKRATGVPFVQGAAAATGKQVVKRSAAKRRGPSDRKPFYASHQKSPNPGEARNYTM